MIPLQLTVKNFMCYRDNVPTLDFESIHVACLCGDNGHGKSALLDAITWVLWGQARTRTQEELVHQGQQDMSVELDFMAQGQRYRASRRHSRSARSRQGSTLLELQVASESGDSFSPITGNTIRDTEARIIEILHLDYDTFTNTAFLMQGQADLFTRSSPTKRKECLAEVLDLSYYQKLEERAKTRSRSFQEEMRDAETAIEVRRQDISTRPEYENQLAVVTNTLTRITPEVEAERKKLEALKASVLSLQGQKSESERIDIQLTTAERDVTNMERQVSTYQARVAEYQKAIQQDQEIRARFAELQASRAELERLNQALARKSQLDAEKAKLEQDLALQAERISQQVAQLRNSIANDLEPKAKRLPEIAEAINSIGGEQAALQQQEQALNLQRTEGQSITARIGSLGEANAALVKEMEETRKKYDMLEQGNMICPLCNQSLGEEGQQHLRSEYMNQGRESKSAYQKNIAEKASLEQKHKDLTASLSSMEAALRQGQQQVDSKLANLQRDKADSEKAQVSLEETTTQLQKAEALLQSKDFAHAQRERLNQLDAEIAALQYDSEKHDFSRSQVTTLEPYAELHRKLLEAVEKLPAEQEALEAVNQMLGQRRQEIQDATQRKAALEDELRSLPSTESLLKDVETHYNGISKQKDAAMVNQGVLRKQIERLTTLEAEIATQEKQHRGMAEQKGIYDDLTAAFGKNGIQALIIESAIPQLESDANELLGRLTENRMFLRLQLQEGRKDSRTGLPSEELDIRIADEVGTRSYETFSGGEAFRINFAIRIALSKLLARRSGAPLPILFIDEGFGSQDRVGQERLTEAIQSIQNDFEKIIVITHIDQIKEAFPLRIEVTKNGNGSTFEIV